MARLTDLLLGSLIPILILAHLYLSPYTKVEESFNVQAAHDILTYGIPSNNIQQTFRREYDHVTFPGAVPRTFVGAVMLSGIASPFIWLFSSVDGQFLIRAVLGLFNAFALLSYAGGIRRAFGKTAAVWYILLQASQFHVIYYASRPLPNMYAFGICTLALRYLLPDPSITLDQKRSSKRHRLSLYLFTITGIIFRSEIALFLATTTIYLWLQNRISIRKEIIPAGLFGIVIGLLVTVCIDSFFWQKFPLWPEFAAFKFNVLAGQASAWGTQPWHFYFTNALPRLLLNPLTYLVGIPLACLLPSTRQSASSILTPSLAYIAIYSLLPHKEWRFVLYTIPSLTATSALGASYIWTRRSKSLLYRISSFALVLSTLASCLISTCILLPVSMANYPGAHALNALHAHAHDSQRIIRVHMDTLACQTGVTRFLQFPPPKSLLVSLPGSDDGRFPALRSGSTWWKYDKTEDEEIKGSAAFWDKIDYALVEDEKIVAVAAGGSSGRWEVLQEITAFGGIRVLRPGEEGRGGEVEGQVIDRLFGDAGLEGWKWIREMGRKHLTGGWWAEVKMVPKIKILKHIR
ncbi:hypothetical protein AJ80_01061 [Polytolypa hystricis UAMH7299]|uniref:Mannosyltransferase n=1 Tax=Polytolypa hystricis (strain UAMH7299) TaxID=1447883 RepID=A0A2B7Z280_POLH7|nr:hypothetical protein AJ80_01061 [Polytolypa hystricis UAMH7299]